VVVVRVECEEEEEREILSLGTPFVSLPFLLLLSPTKPQVGESVTGGDTAS
jgi:hypothetical protein